MEDRLNPYTMYFVAYGILYDVCTFISYLLIRNDSRAHSTYTQKTESCKKGINDKKAHTHTQTS